MIKAPSLIRYLRHRPPPLLNTTEARRCEKNISMLQLKMLRCQQGIWHRKQRAIFVFEGFDASGKGGAIQRLVERIDPRGFGVHPIGPPDPTEQAKHYLYRFWQRIPGPGVFSVFDRSWYGRVLIERVEGLCPKPRWKGAFREINEFERMLADDGVEIVKFFLAITPEEQLRRFEERLGNPYKQWKITEADVRARAKWDDYARAAEEMLERTHTRRAPWHLIPADDKHRARELVLQIATDTLKPHRVWLEKKVEKREIRSLKEELRRLSNSTKGPTSDLS